MKEIQKILQQKVFTRRQFEEIPAAIRRLLVVEEKRVGRLVIYIVRGVLPEPRRRRGKIAKLAEAVESLVKERGCVRVSDFDGAPRPTVYWAIRRIKERLGLVYIRPYWCLPGKLPPVAVNRRAVAPGAVLKEAARLCRTGRFKLSHLMRRLQLPAAAAPVLAALLKAVGYRREEQWYLCESPSFSAPGRRLRS